MAMNLFEMFKFSKTISWEDGEIKLMSTYVSVVPSTLLIALQKSLIEKLGFEKAYNQIYDNTRKGSFKWNEEFVKAHNFKEKRKIVDWQWKIVTFAGWGKWEIINLELDNNRLNAKFIDSPLTKQYGKSKYPVDFVATAFSAGGISVAFGADLDCIETKCQAMGHPYCEIEIGEKDYIAKRKDELWKKWGLRK